MGKDEGPSYWADEALAALSEPEHATKAEVGLAVNRVEKAIEEYGDNPAPSEYDTLISELKRPDTDVERCRQSLQAIRDQLGSD